MRRIAALLVLVGACSIGLSRPPRERTGIEPVDCSDSYVRPVLDGVAFVATTVATIAGFASDFGEDCGAIDCVILPFGVAAAIMLPISSAHGFEVVHQCRSTQARVARNRVVEEAAVQRAMARDEAWRLTKQAAAAARADDCAAVRTTSASVSAADEEFHATVFVRDVAIARCLAP